MAEGVSSDEPCWEDAWGLDSRVDFLNHGSFGACPLEVLAKQQTYRSAMESRPVAFLHRKLEPKLDHAREVLASVVGTSPANLVFVPNATTGVNTVLRGVQLEPGDGILVTNHGYNACRNVVEFVARRWSAEVQVAEIPVPMQSTADVLEAVLGAVRPNTRWAVLDHITSPTAVVFPIAELVAALRRRGVTVIVDGAHGPGMVSLDVDAIGADFYTGNCHKWLCAPKGAGFLAVAPAWHERLQPVVVSHGANSMRRDRSRLHLEFDWVGTLDPTAWLCVADAISFLERYPGGLAGVMRANRELVLAGSQLLMDRCGLTPVVEDNACCGSMVALQLPPLRADVAEAAGDCGPLGLDPLHVLLSERYQIEVPVFPAPGAIPQAAAGKGARGNLGSGEVIRGQDQRLVRISAQRYNRIEQYDRLATVLCELL